MSNRARPGYPLTPAEELAVRCVAEGVPDKLIGRRLEKSYLTVRDQINSAKRKLGARTRAHLVSLWLRGKL